MAFTKKGLAVIEIIMRDYSTTETFTAAKLGVAPAVLTSLAKDGYLIRQDTNPVSYMCNVSCREKMIKTIQRTLLLIQQKKWQCKLK